MMVGVLCLYREEIAMNKYVLKDVFLHGETHAAMPIDCKEPVYHMIVLHYMMRKCIKFV